MKNIYILTLIASMSLGAIGAVAINCTPAQQAETQQIENVVLADLKAGKTLPQIEDDVAAIVLPGQAGADIVTIVNDAISLLVDVGVISGDLVAKAKTLQAELATKHAAGLKR
jgi:hypothetical protein